MKTTVALWCAAIACAFAQNYLDGNWVKDGSALVTTANYTGLSRIDSNGIASTISSCNNAGYRPAISPDGDALAFSVLRDDGSYAVFLGEIAGHTFVEIYTGDVGKPFWLSNEELAFCERNCAPVFSRMGKFLRRIDLPCSFSTEAAVEFIVWCNDENFLQIYNRTTQKLTSLSDSGLFSPKISPCGNFVLAKKLGGKCKIFDLRTAHEIGSFVGEYPRWVDKPRGIITLLQTDDGEKLLSSEAFFVPFDGKACATPRKLALPQGGKLLTRIDYRAENGFLLFFDDGTFSRLKRPLAEFFEK